MNRRFATGNKNFISKVSIVAAVYMSIFVISFAGNAYASETGNAAETGNLVESDNSIENGNIAGDSSSEALENVSESAQICTVIIPEGYELNSDGIFVSSHAPLDSSNISYKIIENDDTAGMTNNERAEYLKENSGKDNEEIDYSALTKEIFDQKMTAAYKKLYGNDTDFSLDSFEEKSFDGCSGYAAECMITPESQKIIQNIYIVNADTKTYIITYSQAEDDDKEEIFAQSAATIHVM